jgi:hypothetical protein
MGIISLALLMQTVGQLHTYKTKTSEGFYVIWGLYWINIISTLLG